MQDAPDLSTMEATPSAELAALLDALAGQQSEPAEMVQLIEQRFGAERAVLVVDMVGFSQCVESRGAVTALLMIQRMRVLSEPAIERQGGVVIRTEADNLFAVFDEVAPAVAASREIMQALDFSNATNPCDEDLYASIGIGFGSILLIGNERIVGSAVNQAFRLGEDVALRGEILLSEAAYAELGDSTWSCEARVDDPAGVRLDHYVLLDQG
jgi:adenylate cyclase